MPALSASPVSLNPGVNAVYRFRTMGSHFHPSTPGLSLSGANWGLHAGDINGDGMVTSADYVIWFNQARMSGEGSVYVDGNLNLDGKVDALDYDLWRSNARQQPTAAGADAGDVQNDE